MFGFQCYLCRSFDSLNKGQDYRSVRPAVQIGILDYTLFPESPEFYAAYRLMNVKTHKIYSDKLCLCVLDLNHIELATEEDRAHQIDCWARLFKASMWKEMKLLAKQDPILAEAVHTAVVLSEGEKIRLQCEAREDYYRRVGWKDEEIKKQAQKIEQLNADKQQWASEKQQFISEKQQFISDKQDLTSENQQLVSEVQRLRQLLKTAGISDTQDG